MDHGDQSIIISGYVKYISVIADKITGIPGFFEF